MYFRKRAKQLKTIIKNSFKSSIIYEVDSVGSIKKLGSPSEVIKAGLVERDSVIDENSLLARKLSFQEYQNLNMILFFTTSNYICATKIKSSEGRTITYIEDTRGYKLHMCFHSFGKTLKSCLRHYEHERYNHLYAIEWKSDNPSRIKKDGSSYIPAFKVYHYLGLAEDWIHCVKD